MTEEADEIREGKTLTITQMTVNIMVLRVGSKQVTQSVFKQLPKADPFDVFGDPSGEMWGWVNYCPGCSKDELHLHVVFRLGDEICRGNVYSPRSYEAHTGRNWHGMWIASNPLMMQRATMVWLRALKLPQLFIAV